LVLGVRSWSSGSGLAFQHLVLGVRSGPRGQVLHSSPDRRGKRGPNSPARWWSTGRTTARKCSLCRMEQSSQLQNCIHRGGRERRAEASHFRWLAIRRHSPRIRWTDLTLIRLRSERSTMKVAQKWRMSARKCPMAVAFSVKRSQSWRQFRSIG
jgi:hypothetical protein